MACKSKCLLHTKSNLNVLGVLLLSTGLITTVANFRMSGTEETFHYTKEDVRKLESRESKLHGGSVPKDAESSHLKVASLRALAYL